MYDTDRYYSLYIDKALKILKKYETQCNPKNKKLVKVTNKCDYTFENNYTHGGYECGDDGYWSTKCVASYCDLGYIFDYAQGKCIIDYCSDLNKEGENIEEENEEEENIEEENEEEKNIEEENNEGNNKKKMILIIVICSCIFALIIAIIIIAIVINYKRKKDESDYEDIAKISLSIQDRTG